MMKKYSKLYSSKIVMLFVLLYIFLVMFIVKPFGISRTSGPDMYLNLVAMIGAIGLTCFLLLRVYDVAMPYDKVGAPYLVVAMIIGSSVSVWAIGFFDFFVQVNYWNVLKELIFICILPSLLFWVYFDRIFYATYYEKASKVTKSLQIIEEKETNIEEPVVEKPKVKIIGKNQDNQLEISPDELVFMMAQENYCQITYTSPEGLKNLMFRNSLSDLFDQVKDADESIIRCHRTYVVNLRHVEKMSGNARGYVLKIKDSSYEIPVSRNFPDMFLLKKQFTI